MQNNQHVSPNLPSQERLRQYTLIVYCLYLASLLIGVTGIVAIIMNYIKRDEVQGTWLQSHFDWQIKTFWYSVLGAVIGFILAIVLIGYVILLAVSIWFIYRIIKGFIVFLDNKPIGSGWV